MIKEERKIDIVAQAIYNANWKELSVGRFPPVWKEANKEIRDFVCDLAKTAIYAFEQYKDRIAD